MRPFRGFCGCYQPYSDLTYNFRAVLNRIGSFGAYYFLIIPTESYHKLFELFCYGEALKLRTRLHDDSCGGSCGYEEKMFLRTVDDMNPALPLGPEAMGIMVYSLLWVSSKVVLPKCRMCDAACAEKA